MQTSQWLGSVGIAEVHVADGRHDGYIDVHVGVAFNQKGVTALGNHCVPKVKRLDSVAADTDRKVVKFIAEPKDDGSTLSTVELTKLANGAIRSMMAWAATLDEHDVLALTTGLTEAQILASMADHSETRHHVSSES